MSGKKKKQVFIGYNQKDVAIFNRLKNHLSELVRNDQINIWHEEELLGGAEREKEIKQQLKQSDFVLLILSADFIADDFCYNTLLKEAVVSVNNSNARLLTILARECSWEDSPLAHYTVLPDRKLPIESRRWRTADEAYTVIARSLKALVKGEEIPYFDFGEEGEIEVKEDPAAFKKYKTRGTALYRQKKYTAAMELFQKALAIREEEEMYYNIGQCHRLLNQLDQALHAYEMAIALNAKWAWPCCGKSRVFQKQGKITSALASIKEAIKKAPTEGVFYVECAEILFAQQRYPETIEQCNLAIQYSPNHPRAHALMGFALRWQGRNKEALPFYQKVVALSKYDYQGFTNLGNVYYDLGKQKLALENYRIALKLKPDYEPAKKGVAKISFWYK